MKALGDVLKYGDNIDTDVIIPARYLNSSDPAELATHCMEDLDVDFLKKLKPGDIVIGGKNFGCGSSREHAPLCIKAAGVSCVIAKSFARIFYRNAINIGFPILECEEAVNDAKTGHKLEVDFKAGIIKNVTLNKEYTAHPFPEFIINIMENDGLVNCVRENKIQWGKTLSPSKEFNIAVIPGDGIGVEVTAIALQVMEKTAEKYNVTLHFTELYAGGCAIDYFGEPLPTETLAECQQSAAVLLGAVGGPKWDHLGGDQRPEKALLGLRGGLGLYANLRPAKIYEELKSASPLKDSIIANGIDMLIVRELTGGIYFGERGRKLIDGLSAAFDSEVYSEKEISRIARTAFEAALKRRNKVTLVDKANILETSRLWREVVATIAKAYPQVELNHMYVDNASMQLVKNPSQFDVILTSNMFGDILSDEASMITGSIGMLASASVREDSFGMYEPIHGSAPDIAGQDLANPLAQILSAAMLFEYSLHLPEAARVIENAVQTVLRKGYRTGDIWTEGFERVGTQRMGELVLAEI